MLLWQVALLGPAEAFARLCQGAMMSIGRS
jgi:hypothetical protein